MWVHILCFEEHKQLDHKLLSIIKIKVMAIEASGCVTQYSSPRQKYFKQKLQLRSAYHMILHQNESTKNFSAILAGSLWQDKSAQPAWVKL